VPKRNKLAVVESVLRKSAKENDDELVAGEIHIMGSFDLDTCFVPKRLLAGNQLSRYHAEDECRRDVERQFEASQARQLQSISIY
jgi:hypothetical protein